MKYALILLVMLVTACSCNSQSEPLPTTHTPEPADAIDQNLMIALSKAKNFHHKAKVYMSDGNIAEAIASVREILSLQFPAGAPEAEDVRNDARALLAKLLLGQGNVDEAMRVVTEGIAQSQRKSFFVANLYTVKGEILEARAAQQPPDEAKKTKHEAIEAYDTSNQIDTELQKQLMESR
jgi:predicted negative regulator of RcsB-dependent stress response